MIGEAIRLFKANFNKRLGIYFAVVTCFTMFGSIPYTIIKIPFLIAFIPFASLFIYLISKNLIYPNFKFLIKYRKSIEIPAPEQIQNLAKKMGSNLKNIRIIDCEKKNAFATNNGITFTKGLLQGCNKEEIMAVAAHEIEHRRGHHALYKMVIMAATLLFTMFSWSSLTAPIFLSPELTQSLFQIMMETALLAFMIVAMIPVSWYMELKADKAAAKYVGKQHIQSALLKLTNAEESKLNSETHPAIIERVKNIEKIKI